MGCESLFGLDTNDIEIETLASVLTTNMQEFDWEDPKDKNELLYGDFGALHLLNQTIKIANKDLELRTKLQESVFRPLLKRLRLEIKKCSLATGTEEKASIIELFNLVNQLMWTLGWGDLKKKIPGLKCYVQDSLVGEFGFECPCFADCKCFPRKETGVPDRKEICNFWIDLDYWDTEIRIVTWEDFEKVFKTKIKVEE